MKKLFTYVIMLYASLSVSVAQQIQYPEPVLNPESCTSIMVGKKASADGSVMTSHTCDSNYRTWMDIVPSASYDHDTTTTVYTGRMHTEYAEGTRGMIAKGTLPEARSTYQFLNTAYPCLNEKQLGIGETTITGRKALVNKKGMFMIEELQRIALQRCTTARDAIRLMGELIEKYGYGDWGECLTIADPKEVWHFEVFGEGPAPRFFCAPARVNLIGEQAVTYPAPKVMTGAEIDQAITRTDDALAQYVQFKATTVISGNYINFNIEGATTAQGSIYQATDAQKALFTDGAEVTVEGYFISISSGKFFNVVPTKVNGVKAQVIKRGLKRAASVPTTTYNAVYHYDNGRWTVPANFCVLNPADYTAMGSTTQDLSAPAKYLPTYLASKYPYAQQGDIRNVMYRFYNSSSKETSYACDQYTFDGSAWVINTGIVTETAQFVRTGGKWMYDPNVTITLPAGRNQELSTKYFQACVDWVFNNICKPMGDTDIKSGAFYVTKHGNNEYYSGTSAYQGNVDLRASAARAQYPTGYEGMTDDEIVELEKQRFMNEVMPGALSMLHPDAKPIEGLDVIYTINFSVYTGTTTAYTARFRVIAPGKFEPVDCTWDNKAE